MEIINGKDLANKKFIITEDGFLKEYKPKGRYIPEKGEKYYFITHFGDINPTINNSESDDYLILHNFVFKTKEECKDYRDFLDKLYKYKTDFSREEWENKKIRKYSFIYDCSLHSLSFRVAMDIQGYNYYFTEENIKKFVDEVGKDRIKKYLFNIWEE